MPRSTLQNKRSLRSTTSAQKKKIAVAKLLGTAKAMVENSTSPDAQGFDCAKWLGRWLEVPQPALGGRKPADLLDTPTGVEIVSRLLGSIESGAYQ